MKKFFLNAIILSIILTPLLALPAMAQTQPNIGLNYAQQLGLQNTNSDPRETAIDVVKYLMTFLGIIAVVVILLGGFKWMTAGGNEDKVAEAKKLLVAGIIGLIIILAAFAIVTFVVDITQNAISGSIE